MQGVPILIPKRHQIAWKGLRSQMCRLCDQASGGDCRSKGILGSKRHPQLQTNREEGNNGSLENHSQESRHS